MVVSDSFGAFPHLPGKEKERRRRHPKRVDDIGASETSASKALVGALSAPVELPWDAYKLPRLHDDWSHFTKNAREEFAADTYDKNFIQGFLNDGHDDRIVGVPEVCCGTTLKSRARRLSTLRPLERQSGVQGVHRKFAATDSNGFASRSSCQFFDRLRACQSWRPHTGAAMARRMRNGCAALEPLQILRQALGCLRIAAGEQDQNVSQEMKRYSVAASVLRHLIIPKLESAMHQVTSIILPVRFLRRAGSRCPTAPTSTQGADGRSKRLVSHQIHSLASTMSSKAEDTGQDGMRPKKREACESLRLLIFGRVGNEEWPACKKHNIFQQNQGTNEEIKAFMETWLQLDVDGSGDVDLEEFLAYFSKRGSDKVLGMRCIRYLVGNGLCHVLGSEDDEDRYGSCTKEDMLQLLWPRATPQDIDRMNEMFDLQRLLSVSVPAPPLLSHRRRKQLLENFRYLDSTKSGVVRYLDLVDAGFVDRDDVEKLRELYDEHDEGVLDEEQFVEMLCPSGYRANVRVNRARDRRGLQVSLCTSGSGATRFLGWLPDEVFQDMKDQFKLAIVDRGSGLCAERQE